MNKAAWRARYHAKAARYDPLDSSRATRGTWPDDGPASGSGAVPMPGSMKEDSIAHLEEPQFRLAGPADAEAVANLHADSWRRHYRGAYSDAFLDGDVVADRLAVWTERLREPDPRRCTILAEDARQPARCPVGSPAGSPDRRPLRYAWTEPTVLLVGCRACAWCTCSPACES